MTEPTRRDRMRPFEYLGIAFAIALFTALISLMSTRDWLITVIAFGGVFILALLTLALVVLAMKPDQSELDDLDEQNKPRLH